MLTIHFFAPALASLSIPLAQVLANQAVLALIFNQLGGVAVAVFSAHRTLANMALQVVQSISHAMLPEFSLAFGAGDQPLARRLHRRACQLSVVIGLVSCIFVGFLAQPLLPIWTSGRILFSLPLMVGLLLGVATRSLWYTSLFVPMSINLHHRIAVALVIGTLASLAIAFPLTRSLGLTGTTYIVPIDRAFYVDSGIAFIVEVGRGYAFVVLGIRD